MNLGHCSSGVTHRFYDQVSSPELTHKVRLAEQSTPGLHLFVLYWIRGVNPHTSSVLYELQGQNLYPLLLR